MRKNIFFLQLFADGAGEGAAPGAGDGEGQAVGAVAKPTTGRKSNGLENVVYGVQPEDTQKDDVSEKEGSKEGTASDNSGKNAGEAFDELIKGEYRDAFNQKMHAIINERMKKVNASVNALQEKQDKLGPMLDMLASRYEVDASDIDGLVKAFKADKVITDEVAAKSGMSMDQFEKVHDLEKQNMRMREQIQRTEQEQEGARLMEQWSREGEALKAKYGLPDFDLHTELANKDFVSILQHNGSVEAAYKAVHFDEIMMSGMAKATQTAKEDIVKSMSSKASRPGEAAASSKASVVVKKNVEELTSADMKEIKRRVRNGETISFSS